MSFFFKGCGFFSDTIVDCVDLHIELVQQVDENMFNSWTWFVDEKVGWFAWSGWSTKTCILVQQN